MDSRFKWKPSLAEVWQTSMETTTKMCRTCPGRQDRAMRCPFSARPLSPAPPPSPPRRPLCGGATFGTLRVWHITPGHNFISRRATAKSLRVNQEARPESSNISRTSPAPVISDCHRRWQLAAVRPGRTRWPATAGARGAQAVAIPLPRRRPSLRWRRSPVSSCRGCSSSTPLRRSNFLESRVLPGEGLRQV